MKTLIKATLVLATISIFASSCTSKKQHCDAYGVISKVENNKVELNNTNNEIIVTEVKS